MKPKIVSCDSSDVTYFFDYQPIDPEDFGFPLNLTIGIEGEVWTNNFQIMVATPKYIQKTHPKQSAVLLRHYLVVFQYDFNDILDVLNNYVRSIDEDTWEKVVEKIGRIAQWEYEDYKPF